MATADQPPPPRPARRSDAPMHSPSSATRSTSGSPRPMRTATPTSFPLSFYWDGSALTIATPRRSRTAVNLIRAGWARVALGPTRDVLIVEGPLEQVPTGADVPTEDAHARATGFDPRTLSEEYVYLRITPHEMQAWREANELAGRRLMKGGRWLE